MGTSSSYSGPGGGSPLIPSWLNGGIDDDTSKQEQKEGKKEEKKDKPIVIQLTDRYRQARSNLSRFARSGASDYGSLKRALSSYVSKSSGGSRNAVRRMGSSRSTAVNLIGLLNSVSAKGITETLKSLKLSDYIGQPIENIFGALSDYLCPDGGTVDEGIARNAFIETIIDLTEAGITDLDSLNPEQMIAIIEIFITHAIEGRLCNDIGSKLFVSPQSISAVEQSSQYLQDYIHRSVADALNLHKENFSNLSSTEILKFVDSIYEDAFDILMLNN